MALFPVAVPNVPGVPSVSFAGIGDVLSLLVGDALGLLATTILGRQWGLYLGFVPAIVADTVLTFEYNQAFAVADYPIEGGRFEDYDRVQVPFDVRFRFAAAGLKRQALLDSVAAVASTTLLYNGVTPDAVYPSLSLVSWGYQRSSQQGVDLLTVDVDMIQIRVAPAPLITSTQDPSSQDQVNDGVVQAQAPTTAQSAAAAGSTGD